METPEKKMTWSLTLDHQPERADLRLTGLMSGYSRSAVAHLITGGHVRVDGQVMIKPGSKLKPGQVIDVEIPAAVPACGIVARELPFDVIYEDNDLLVVNKPRGMVVHPANGHQDDTLVNALLGRYGRHLSAIHGEIRPGIVHRLDKDTSGLMVVARNDTAHLELSNQLKIHTVQRIYTAISDGIPAMPDFAVDAPIGRHPVQRLKMAIVENGRAARTRFTLLETFRDAACLQAALETGRTHQIRVHIAYAGYPLLGDPLYNTRRSNLAKAMRAALPDLAPGQWLHAGILSFRHPVSGEILSFKAPLPPDFQAVLSWLRGRMNS